ncbi:STAS domain protein [Candidatus Gugararchaeum adminiculabundum]|nr:STAS domain protein [Candidatus Gugararchaeum adminiculabundum]
MAEIKEQGPGPRTPANGASAAKGVRSIGGYFETRVMENGFAVIKLLALNAIESSKCQRCTLTDFREELRAIFEKEGLQGVVLDLSDFNFMTRSSARWAMLEAGKLSAEKKIPSRVLAPARSLRNELILSGFLRASEIYPTLETAFAGNAQLQGRLLESDELSSAASGPKKINERTLFSLQENGWAIVNFVKPWTDEPLEIFYPVSLGEPPPASGVLADLLAEAEKSQAKGIILNLQHVEGIDIEGWALLSKLGSSAKYWGVPLRLVIAKPEFLKICGLCHMLGLFEFYSTLEAAIAGGPQFMGKK